MTWLVVTPARNEAARLPGLAASLAAQTRQLIGLWVIVDDGSTDGTAEIAAALDPGFPVRVLSRQNEGGLTGASEFAAFLHGADEGLRSIATPERVMKCDADLRLLPTYLEELRETPPEVGVCGGVLAGLGELEQVTYVLGGLKAYTPAAYRIVRQLPVALGWDVLDEVALRLSGLEVRVMPTAVAVTSRRTGSSEGLLAGRRRNGAISRWVGYHPAYFALRVLRFLVRKPVVLGALALVQGYATAGRGPHPDVLRRAMRDHQAAKLKNLLRNPVRFLTLHYGLGRGAGSGGGSKE